MRGQQRPQRGQHRGLFARGQRRFGPEPDRFGLGLCGVGGLQRRQQRAFGQPAGRTAVAEPRQHLGGWQPRHQRRIAALPDQVHPRPVRAAGSKVAVFRPCPLPRAQPLPADQIDRQRPRPPRRGVGPGPVARARRRKRMRQCTRILGTRRPCGKSGHRQRGQSKADRSRHGSHCEDGRAGPQLTSLARRPVACMPAATPAGHQTIRISSCSKARCPRWSPPSPRRESLTCPRWNGWSNGRSNRAATGWCPSAPPAKARH